MPSAPSIVSDLGLDAGFSVLGELGRGEQAVVYRVRRSDSEHGDGEYALKVLRGPDRRDPAGLREFRRQAALLACVEDPALPRVRMAGESGDGTPYVMSDFVPGVRLDERIAGGRLDEAAAVRLGADLAGALGAVHAVNLVHRDVKPANILVTAEGAGRLLDFGLATRSGEPQDPDLVAGTMTYSPPEQTGMISRPVDARSDLYALGAVLFECVTGEPPYAAGDVGELLHLHATAPVPDARSLAPVSASFAAIVAKLLAKDPDDRYESAAGLLADLRTMPDVPGLHDTPVTFTGSPFAGRDAELRSLKARWQEAAGGRGGVVAVRGVAGSGKTRILQEVIGYAATTPATVLRGTAVAGDHRPLAAIRDAIDDYLRAGGVAGFRVRAAAAHAPSLLQSLSPAMAELLGAPRPAADVTQEQFAATVATMLVALARGGPVLLHLDDAHAADEATRRVLERLHDDLDGVPLLVALTSRDDTELPADLTVTLGPLTVDGVATLLRAMSHGRAHSAAGVARTALLTGGNPHMILEYARSVLDAGLIWPVWDGWRTDDDGLRELALPGDTAQLVLRRIDRLSAEDLLVLRTGAVCGATVSPTALATLRSAAPRAPFAARLAAEVAETPLPHALDALARAARHGLVEPTGGGNWAFRHDSIRTALLAALDGYELRRWHDRVASALDKPGADAYALAGHCAAGSPGLDPGRLVRAARAAGERALAEYAPATALAYLCQARDAAAEYDVPLDAGFDQALGVAYHRNGCFAEALDALRRALSRTTTRTGRARAHQLIAHVQESAGLGLEVLESSRLGLAALGRPLPSGTAAMFATALAYCLAGTGFRLAGSLFAAPEDESLQLQSLLYHYGASGAVRGMRQELMPVFAMLQAYPTARLGDSPEHAKNLVSMTFFFRLLGMTKVADKQERKAVRIAAEIGDPALSAYVDWMAGLAKHATGEDTGESLWNVLDQHRDTIDTGLALDAAAILAADHVVRGDAAAAELVAERRRPFVEQGGNFERGSVVCTDASVLALRGRPGEAARLLAEHGPAAGAPAIQLVDLHIARIFGALERDDLGAAFEEIDASFASLGVGPRSLLPTQAAYFIWLGYGYLARARRAEGTQKAAEIAQARRAIAALGKTTRRPLVNAHRRILRAGLLQAQGRPAKALAALAAAGPALRAVDAPLTAYEQAILTARCHADLSVPGESERQARYAYDLALRHGWPHRARRVATEFGIDAGGRTVAVTGAGRDRRAAALEQVSLAASRVLDPARLTRVALDETIRMLGAERAFLFLVDDSDVLAPYAGRDAEGQDLRELTGFSSTAVDRVRHTRESLVVTGSEQGSLDSAGSVVRFGLRSILVAPLLLDERLLGVVYLDSRVAKGVFTLDDVELLAAVTHHVAVALETARAAQLEVAVAAATRQRDLAETLRAAMTRFTATLEPGQVLRELVAVAPGADAQGWVLLATPGGTGVRTLDGLELPLAWLLGVHEPRVGGGGGWTSMLSRDELQTWMVVPLEGRDGTVGSLVLGASRPGAWTDADLRVTAALAGQAMIAYENALLFSRVRELATIDSLTGVANRRHFFALAESALAEPGPVTALMLDIDHFKKINDTYGHQSGDDVIREVVARLVRVLDGTPGFAGRYGGEEFALLVPGDSAAAELGERLRAAVAATPVVTRSGEVPVTISVGGTRRRDGETAPDVLLGRADAGLYEAKQTGRNRVVAHEA